MSEANTKISFEEQFNDFETTPVPPERRQTWLEQGMAWLGSGFGLSGLATGGLLANGLSFNDMIIVSIIGSLVITIIGCVNALISAKLHYSTTYTSRFSFGRNGARILGVIICISNFGWFAFQADMFGTTVASILKQTSGMDINSVIFTIIGGLAMSTTAIFGFKAIKLLSMISMPLLFILCGVAVWKTTTMIPLETIMASGPVGDPMTIAMGVSIVVGSYAVGIAIIGDFSRFSKSKKDCVYGVSLGYFFGYIPVLIIGAFFNYAFSNWNIVEVMIGSLGLGIFGALVLILGQWTTNDNNLYSSVLGLSNSLEGIKEIPRMRLSFIVGIISTAIAAIGVYKYFVTFLSMLGVFIIPITGILIADYYICGKEKYANENYTPQTKINPRALIAWIAAAFVGLTMTATSSGGLGLLVSIGDIIPVPIIGMLTALVVYAVLEKSKKHA